MINNKLLIILFLTGLLFLPYSPVSAAGSSCRVGREGYCAELAAVIPGLEFLKYDESKGLGGFIASLYVFGLGLVGFSALIMLIYASFLYMTAGDNMNRVGEAKKKISGALFGLILAFLSWLILRTINPDLVKGLDIKLEPITWSAKAPPISQGGTPMAVGRPCDATLSSSAQCPSPLVCRATPGSKGTCQFPPENVSGKQAGSVDAGRTCENTGQCQTGLECNKVAGSPYPGICVNTAGLTFKEGSGLKKGEICDPNISNPCGVLGTTQLRCLKINPLTSETRCN